MRQSRALTLYSRNGCHLCEEAEALLRRLGLNPDVVDVDGSSDLQARYSDQVPVLAIDGQTILSGIITENKARLALAEILRELPR
jgi:glutaredoxin